MKERERVVSVLKKRARETKDDLLMRLMARKRVAYAGQCDQKKIAKCL